MPSHLFSQRGRPLGRFRSAFRAALISATAGCAALFPPSAFATTTINVDAALQDFLLFGVDNPLPAVPLRAQITVVYDETSPPDISLGEGTPLEGGGQIYENAVQSFTMDLFDEFGGFIAQAVGNDAAIWVMDDYFGFSDRIVIESLNMTGIPPLREMSLLLEGPVTASDVIDLSLFGPDTLNQYTNVVGTIAGFPESDLVRMTFVPRDGFLVDQGPAPVPLHLPGAYLLAAVGTLGARALYRAVRRTSTLQPA